jgi:hypothetical protein
MVTPGVGMKQGARSTQVNTSTEPDRHGRPSPYLLCRYPFIFDLGGGLSIFTCLFLSSLRPEIEVSGLGVTTPLRSLHFTLQTQSHDR